MQFKKSRYTIVTESIRSGKFAEPVRIVYSTRSARAIVVNEAVCNALDTDDYLPLDPGLLSQLLEIEAIVPAAENELQTVVARNKGAVADNTTLNYVIQPTAQCQLGCGYCGQAHSKKLLDTDDSDNLLKRVELRLNSRAYDLLHIGWFGSEPLMGWKNIQELTPRLQELAEKYGCGYSASIVTNGLSLKENIFLDLIHKYAVNTLEITLDGTAPFHDTRRHTKEGHSTFELIWKNLLAICTRPDFDALGVDITVRCNVDRRNVEGVSPLIELLATHGLQQKVNFYTAPIHSWGNDAHLLSLTKEEYADKEIDWIMEMAKLNFRLSGLIPSLKEIVCISVTPDAEVVDAFGNVYNCTEIPYVPVYEGSAYVLDNLKQPMTDTPERRRAFADWYERIETEDNTCSNCRMLPVCGGMCPKSWEEGIPACPSNKINIEDKLILAYLYTNNEFVS
jgi:uncharacterized protein